MELNLNSTRLAWALQYVRDNYITLLKDKSDFLIPPGTVITGNEETEDAPYSDDDEVTLRGPDGSTFVLTLTKVS